MAWPIGSRPGTVGLGRQAQAPVGPTAVLVKIAVEPSYLAAATDAVPSPPPAEASIMTTMPIYRLTKDAIQPLTPATFAQQGVKERGDLQRLLRADISVVADDVLVIAEEFSEWEDSRCRIDLLCIDRAANLVVVELKRDDDGGHMELQALRYAAMVNSMTFARAVDVFQTFLDQRHEGQDARHQLLEFLGWDEPREDDFARDVRIILVSADFSKEITTSVLWLNERDLDIRCVRMKPYQHGAETIMDVQQVVPLPEAQEYTIQIKQKEQAQRAELVMRQSERRSFWAAVLPEVQRVTKRWRNWKPTDSNWIGCPSGVKGLTFYLWVRQNDCGCQLGIDGGQGAHAWNKAVYDALLANRAQVEAKFGRPMAWFRLDDKRSSIIAETSAQVGYRAPQEQWNDAAQRLAESAAKFIAVMHPQSEAAAASVPQSE